MFEKEKLQIRRLVWGALLVVAIISDIVLYVILDSSSNSYDFLYLYLILIFVDIFILAFFIGSLTLSCKVYSYNDKEIVVYAGWYHHYIKVNGIKVDEHNTVMSFTAITMSCLLDDGTDLKATITLSNRISLKINNRLYINELQLENDN